MVWWCGGFWSVLVLLLHRLWTWKKPFGKNASTRCFIHNGKKPSSSHHQMDTAFVCFKPNPLKYKFYILVSFSLIWMLRMFIVRYRSCFIQQHTDDLTGTIIFFVSRISASLQLYCHCQSNNSTFWPMHFNLLQYF